MLFEILNQAQFFYNRIFAVTFDENYAGGKTTEVTVALGETVEEPADPTRSGYDFKGWYTADGEAFDFNAAIEAGAKTVTLCDTAGTMLPGEFARFVKELYD